MVMPAPTGAAAPPAIPATATANGTPASPAETAKPPAKPPATPLAAGAEAKPPEGEVKPPEETKEQKQARLSTASRAARRTAAQHRELLARHQQMEGQLRTAMGRGQTAEQQLSQLRELAKRDPYAANKALGVDLSHLSQQAVREGTPEAEFQRQLAEAREIARAANEKVSAWEKEQQAKAQAEAHQAAVQGFQTEAGNADRYPNVAKLPPAARLAWAAQLLSEDRARAKATMPPEQFARYEPTDRQVLAHMEKLFASSGGPPKAATESSPVESQPGSATPTTVTSALSSAKYTLPANFEKLSDREQKFHMARRLESLGGGKKKKSG